MLTGDLRDPDSVMRAVAGCGAVFHAAADYRLWTRERRRMYRSNVDGHAEHFGGRAEIGVERVVYTSTVGCIGIPREGIGRRNNAGEDRRT